VIEVTDGMPILRARDPDHRQRIVRRVRAIRGSVPMRVAIAPRFDYGRATHWVALERMIRTARQRGLPGPAVVPLSALHRRRDPGVTGRNAGPPPLPVIGLQRIRCAV
jgi:hypothetical protein